MKLMSLKVENENKIRLGLLSEGRIIDLNKAYSLALKEYLPSDMISLLESGEAGLVKIKKMENWLKEEREDVQRITFDFNEVKIQAPIPRTRKNIICLGLNYIDHANETGSPIPQNPVLFTKPPTAIIGMDDPIILPRCSEKIDYEVELAFIFGKRGKNINEEEAYDYIAGYTILVDVTARDLQRKHLQWFKGKSLDTFAPIGPYLVTKDEIPNPHNLELMMKINGNIMQKSNTKNMIFKIPTLIKIISMDMTVEPGDIVATGTPAGVGYTRKPPVYLKQGDVLEASIEGIGTLRNKVTL